MIPDKPVRPYRDLEDDESELPSQGVRVNMRVPTRDSARNYSCIRHERTKLLRTLNLNNLSQQYVWNKYTRRYIIA